MFLGMNEAKFPSKFKNVFYTIILFILQINCYKMKFNKLKEEKE